MESMIEQKKIEDNCDHRDFNELYCYDDEYYIRRRIQEEWICLECVKMLICVNECIVELVEDRLIVYYK